MRRKLAPLGIALTLATLAAAGPAQASAVVPYEARPRGQSYQTWLGEIGQFYLGDASNPLFAALLEGDCGQLIDGVFFMAAPIDVNLEFECDVPPGTPIVLSHAGWFTTEGIDGDTDQELVAAALAGFVTVSNSLSLDGRPLPLQPIDTGAFDVISEPGSFYDAIVGVGTGPVRTALRGNVVFLHPLSRGEHVLEAEVTFANDGGAFSAVYHVNVG